MYRIALKPGWVVERESGGQLGPELFRLLEAIHESGKLTDAAARIGLSYRHAWNLVESWRAFFGHRLVSFERGKGARLTPLGEKLLRAEQRAGARLGPQLESIASELNLELSRLMAEAGSTIRIHASHGFAVARLPDLLAGREDIRLDLRYLGSVESLASLGRGGCDFAGIHVPEAPYEAEALRQYEPWFRPERQRVVHLVTRTQGLFLAPGNPRGILGISDLRRPDVSFVNRQKGSGTRALFEQLLREAGVSGPRIRGYDTEEYTHAAVAAYVASGMADAGFGVEPAARQFRLEFVPLARERYCLLCAPETLERPDVRALLALIRGERFAQLVAELPGYSVPRAGEMTGLEQAFPELFDPARRSAA
jgi:molybdate transport repressor ModE-like protein